MKICIQRIVILYAIESSGFSLTALVNKVCASTTGYAT